MPEHTPLPPAAASPPRRLRCPDCARPRPTCLCRWVRPTGNTLPVLVLQHPREAGHAKGSLALLRLSLQRLQCVVGERFDVRALAIGTGDAAAQWPDVWHLLYPDEGAVASGPPTAARAADAPGGLVVLDGTWRQTRKLLHDNPWLRALPRWPLHAPPPSRYAIRKAQRPGWLSTLEATCLALASVEGRPERYTPLLAAFDGWVAEAQARRPPVA